MPICITNQNTGSVGFTCHVVPNNINATKAIHPNKPISNSASEKISAMIESTRPLSMTLCASLISLNTKDHSQKPCKCKVKNKCSCKTDPKITMLPIKISHVLISSPIVNPAPLWVAETNMLSQNGLLVFLLV